MSIIISCSSAALKAADGLNVTGFVLKDVVLSRSSVVHGLDVIQLLRLAFADGHQHCLDVALSVQRLLHRGSLWQVEVKLVWQASHSC